MKIVQFTPSQNQSPQKFSPFNCFDLLRKLYVTSSKAGFTFDVTGYYTKLSGSHVKDFASWTVRVTECISGICWDTGSIVRGTPNGLLLDNSSCTLNSSVKLQRQCKKKSVCISLDQCMIWFHSYNDERLTYIVHLRVYNHCFRSMTVIGRWVLCFAL